MKVVLVSTYEQKGGAAIACERTFQALRQSNLDVKLLIQEGNCHNPGQYAWASTALRKKTAFARFVAERLYFLPYERDSSVRFAFSPARFGVDLLRHPSVAEADIVHLHWINFGFVSLRSLARLLASGKRVVWTCHDMWAFTGGCHYPGECRGFVQHCGKCPLLKRPSSHDLSQRLWQAKSRTFAHQFPTLVSPSQWLADQARQSSLLGQCDIRTIPNPLDAEKFKPVPMRKARQQLGLPLERTLLLFGAFNVTDPRKGFAFLQDALRQMAAQGFPLPELVLFGKPAPEDSLRELPVRVHQLGVIQDSTTLTQVYSAADLMIFPTLEDNLPNVISEAMACGTPVISFQTGGVPEMIRHQQTGFLAPPQSAQGILNGIQWYLQHEDPHQIRAAARQWVIDTYHPERVARLHLDLYHTLLNR
ncbi:Glycosyltransferase involved in cell wall bisynthesis [Catalinimonas alkaloidigena]|uniref:Glycosyltransferase involved in cell wall bisynthesis n=1 Tax=Catalinimonas alkaloidigena TaxID=1075417 RepID=A0A1G8ZJJ2_9BACT|nr:glycosyltransferase family 4 protein [Catalinimonas alkaloidigena]SDK15188.1 Glycosyltransferase involved in cell wall bisynthesis [Catalinimonas alkaloidigena]